jgi:DNA invertase Pin-like site-specific DNA recombinase
MTTYVGYVRASAKKDTDKNQEFAYQKTECRKIAAAKGVRIGKWVGGVQSTKIPLHKRKTLVEIIDQCNSGLWGGIITSSGDRLVRSSIELEYILREAFDNGWEFLAGDTKYDWSHPDGRLLARIVGALDQHKREIGTFKQTKWSGQRIEDGKPMGPQADPTPEAMAVILNLWNQGDRAKAIANYLNENDFPTPIPHGTKTKRAEKWWPTHITRVMGRYERDTA